ncbi:MAG TPA: polyamine ABC transporter substrate-binding protein [Arenimonas sp.]|nr:polyamine ABC transporter substrate-binding protein [Arenimonas sp.]
MTLAFNPLGSLTMRYPKSGPIAAAVTAALFALAGCSGDRQGSAELAAVAEPAPVASTQLNIYNWSDYIAEDTVANFEAETGIKVVYDVYDGNEILEAKLMAGASGYDLVFPSARPFADRHLQAGIYAELDKSRLSNHGNLDPSLMAGLASIDAGNAHLVPYMWGTTGLGINVGKVREVLGEDVSLDSWDLIFKPEYAEKLAACGISVLDDEQDAFGSALIWQGRDPNAHDSDENDAVAKAYLAVRPHIRYFHSSRYIDDLANGELCVAMGYSGDIFIAAGKAEEAETGAEILYVIPKEGAMRWVDVMAIPADAQHKDAAHAFIDYLLRPEVAASISDYVAYATPVQPAIPLVDPEIAGDTSIYPSTEVAAKLVDPKTLPADVMRERVRTWTTIKTGN